MLKSIVLPQKVLTFSGFNPVEVLTLSGFYTQLLIALSSCTGRRRKQLCWSWKNNKSDKIDLKMHSRTSAGSVLLRDITQNLLNYLFELRKTSDPWFHYNASGLIISLYLRLCNFPWSHPDDDQNSNRSLLVIIFRITYGAK